MALLNKDSYPEDVIAYQEDGIILAGALSPESVAACLAAGVKSWLNLNEPGNEQSPVKAVEAAGIPFECVPLDGGIGPTAADSAKLVSTLGALPRPTMIQCNTAVRAGVAFILFKAANEKLNAASALQKANELNLKFMGRDALRGRVAAALAPDMIFRQLFDTSGSSTYTYLLGDPKSKDAVLIDPVLEMCDRDLQVVDDLGLTLKYVVNTHCHADHVTGSGSIKKLRPGVQSVISARSGADADVKVGHGDRVAFGGLNLEVRATPGHTNGCVSYVCGGSVFTGDALLIRGCGRTDFQEGSAEILYESVQSQLFSLPDETMVYPAHDYKGRMCSTIGEEKCLNPRLSKPLPEFAEIMKNLNLSYPKKIDEALPRNMVCGV